jgi:hypothetical protein
MKNCNYKKDSNEPCDNCPRAMTAFHMCDLLKEIRDELRIEEKINQIKNKQ